MKSKVKGQYVRFSPKTQWETTYAAGEEGIDGVAKEKCQ